MELIHQNSLAATIDEVNEAYFYGHRLTKEQRTRAANWIINKQGKTGAYADLFAPTESDYKKGIQTFTGERIISHAGIGHLLGEESLRALLLLDIAHPHIQETLRLARFSILQRLEKSESDGYTYGMYCCGSCSVALWRNLSVKGLENWEQRLEAGITALKYYRKKNGRWRRFPFYYTLLVLTEVDLPPAMEEIRFVAPACERALKRLTQNDKYAQRKRIVVERVLAKC